MGSSISMSDFSLVKFDSPSLPAFSNLQKMYEAEFSPLMDYDVNEHGEYDQEMLMSHWSPRGYDMYMLYYDKRIPAGFVIVNLASTLDESQQNTRDIAEFYVMPKWRNTGIGKWMAFEIFAKYPGNWEVRQVPGLKARDFWVKVISTFTGKETVEEITDHPQWAGTIQKFISEKKTVLCEDRGGPSSLSNAGKIPGVSVFSGGFGGLASQCVDQVAVSP